MRAQPHAQELTRLLLELARQRAEADSPPLDALILRLGPLAAPLVFACPDGVREVHADCVYLKNVQMLAHIPVAVNAPEGATEAKVVVQYYAPGSNGRSRGA